MSISLPLLGIGTWGMGGTFTQDPGNFRESVEALCCGFELGIRLVDVAELQGEGLAERIVGEAVKCFSRNKICIITKVSREHLDYDGVLRAAEGSLERLGTNYIDVYLVHKLPPENPVPQETTFRAMERLLKEGRVRHIGVSNFKAAQITQASKYLTEAKIETNEIEYNLLFQEAGSETIPYCQSKNIRVIAHRPFGKGSVFQETIPLLDALARKYGKTPAQIALNWLIAQDITAIPKASNREHIKENIGALGWKLSDDDRESLRKLNRFFPYEKIK